MRGFEFNNINFEVSVKVSTDLIYVSITSFTLTRLDFFKKILIDKYRFYFNTSDIKISMDADLNGNLFTRYSYDFFTNSSRIDVQAFLKKFKNILEQASNLSDSTLNILSQLREVRHGI